MAGRELEDLVRGALPGELERWLAVPRQGQQYAEGSVAPLLSQPVYRRPSGLYVPGRAGTHDPAPIDQLGTYLTANEVFGYPFERSHISWLLTHLGARDLLVACAQLLHARENDDIRDFDKKLIKASLAGDARTRALNLVQDQGRWAVAPQLILLAASLALTQMSWEADGTGEPNLQPLTAAFMLSLHVADLLGETSSRPEILFGTVTEGLGLEIIANQMFNSTMSVRGDIARHERLWQVLADQVVNTGNEDPRATFEAGTGVSIATFAAIGFALYAARTDNGPLVRKTLFETTRVTAAELSAVLTMTSTTVDGLRTRLRTDVGTDVARNRWQLDAFSQHPVIDFDENHWLIMSGPLLTQRFFSGLVALDAQAAAKGRTRDRVKLSWTRMTELYGHEVLQAMAPDVQGEKRLYTEADLKRAYARPRQRIADAVIDYGDTWVVLDFSSRTPNRRLAHADDVDAIRKETETLIENKADQLHQTIAALRVDEERLTGRPAPSWRRFIPLIVVHSKWPTNPITTELARLAVKSKGLLQDPNVANLELVTIEELEMVEGVQQVGGPNLAQLLTRKAQGSLYRMGLKDHMLLHERLDVPASRRLDELFILATDRMIGTFGFEPGLGVGSARSGNDATK